MDFCIGRVQDATASQGMRIAAGYQLLFFVWAIAVIDMAQFMELSHEVYNLSLSLSIYIYVCHWIIILIV